ncbi:MAG: saccharopine dehydrogenase NADP-binding domain-containing protein [Gemmatimonadota bacterium]|nr:saccharopine dehydrogenase NADP-binding domain-containing protein [Gemmatimonadota bacterium]MDH5760560.1 saccharopine dehydrogenase NADP-binding domain-containing protein [Gemmatimonadota bacterium]
MKILVLGGGAQGSACAYDLVQRDDVEKVILGDVSVDDPKPFLAPYVGGKLELRAVDATDPAGVKAVMEEVDAVACALPYYFNLEMTRLAIEAGAHFCDLGGNTEIVDQQIELAEAARAEGVSVVPDCGLAPGMVNILAQGGIDALDRTDSVKIFVGGLPQDPKPPLNYQIVYSMEGVLDYYTTPVLVLEGGEVAEKEALTGLETVEFPEPVGALEAFYTAGGISRMPYRYKGTIPSMAYKTLRYPGHAHLMKGMRDLGLMDLEPVEVDGATMVPRDFFIRTVSPKLRNPEGNDLVAMRVEVSGTKEGSPHTVRYDLIDRYDPEHGVTAMERTTGYSLAATAYMQAKGIVEGGVHTPDECIPVDSFIAELANRGVNIVRSER